MFVRILLAAMWNQLGGDLGWAKIVKQEDQ